MDAPKAAASEHEITPYEKAENSGGNEHFRYCTAQGIPGIVRLLTLWSDSGRKSEGAG